MESVSIVIPAYNEEGGLANVVAEIRAAMAERGGAYEIIVVDDGSTDRTAQIAESHIGPDLRVVRHERNRGAGLAIRTGMKNAVLDLVVYVPADAQFDPREIARFATAAEGHDIVVGYRRHRRPYGLVRRTQSAVYLAIVNRVFGQRYRDVNWVHMWRRTTAGSLPVGSEGVFMQQELLDRARRAGMKIAEESLRVPPPRVGSRQGQPPFRHPGNAVRASRLPMAARARKRA
ncbi:MAG: glycosyltransferase family 2 protein [Deltaproteobacteria bacterium]|nr:glycosyltransferase family 2 protein [Deltaproteobacteria bacterium]